jgi:hypothetical protein
MVRSLSRGAEIKLPPEAGTTAEITNCGSGSFLFTSDLKKLYGINHGSWKICCKLLQF